MAAAFADIGKKSEDVAATTDKMWASIDAGTLAIATEGEAAKLTAVALEASEEATRQNVQATQEYEDRLRAGREAQDAYTSAVMQSADVTLNYEKAERNTTKALEEQRVKEEELRVALDTHGVGSEQAKVATEALKDQTLNTKDALLRQADQAVATAAHNAELGGSSLDAAGKAQVQRDFLSQLAQTLAPGSELRAFLDGYIAQLDQVPKAKNTTVRTTYETVYTTYGSPNHGFDIAAETGHAYARGGPLKKGVPALVGEEGPELIMPTADGFVHTAGETASMLSGGFGAGSAPSLGGGGVTVNISGVVGDKDAVIGWVHEGLRQYDSARRTS
jgi:phage-related minor tail protein